MNAERVRRSPPWVLGASNKPMEGEKKKYYACTAESTHRLISTINSLEVVCLFATDQMRVYIAKKG